MVHPSPTGETGTQRPIAPDERSGVLHPKNLTRYNACWFEPDAELGPVVDQYWHVRWQLDQGEEIAQRIIDLPAVTLTIEEGDVPAPFAITGVHKTAWMRRITGTGSVFAIRLRPAGLALLSDLKPALIADATVSVTSDLDLRLHALLEAIAAESTVERRVHAADRAIRESIAESSPGPELVLANALLDFLRQHPRLRAGRDLAERFGVTERTVQRALHATIGHGPKWVSRRIRLQRIAQLLAVRPEPELSELAAELGYTDQAHLTNDFRQVAGITPGAYRDSLADLSGP